MKRDLRLEWQFTVRMREDFMDRSKKAFRNVATGLLDKFVLLLLAFATRTIFIRLLGAEYTGVSSLYTNILSVLSLAELGLGNVLMFYLYSSLKKGNEVEISQLVQEFKKIYNIIIVAILFVGLLLIPFLHYIVNSSLDSDELIVYYVLYLINSVASYFVVYRTTVLSADQNSYITNICSTVSTIVMYILQLAYLFVCRDFFGYLVIQVLCTIAKNLVLNHIACKKYPYLRKKPKNKTEVIDKHELFGNIKATFLFKVSDTILDQTDNIIISIIFGTLFVGYYSNYYLIISYLVNIAGIIVNGLLASYGNLNTEQDEGKSYKMLNVSMLVFSLFGTFCSTCYLCLIQDFVPIWIGEEYVMNYDLVFAVVIVFYLRMVTNTVWIYRSTMGLFREVQYVNVIAAVLNVVLSVLLGMWLGVAGVIVATAVSRLVTSFWYEGKVVFKKLGVPVSKYYLRQLRDLIVAIIIVGCAFGLCSMVTLTGILGMIAKLLICLAITVVVELIANGKTEEFRMLIERAKTVVKRD